METTYIPSRYRLFQEWIIILCFLGFLAAPLLGHVGGFFNTDYFFNTEKRNPAKNPGFPEKMTFSKSYLHQLEAFLKDHFGFRSELIKLNSLTKLLLGVSSTDNVILGKENWLFFTQQDMINQYCGVHTFSEKRLAQWLAAMEARHNWLKRQAIPFVFAVAPNKMTIYPEFLPDWIKKVSDRTRLDQVESILTKHSDIDFINLRPAVQKAKKEYPVYYKTDSHWNFHAGFVGYLEIIQAVKRYFPQLQPLTPKDVNLSFFSSRGKDLANMLNLADLIEEPHADKFKFKFKTHVQSQQNVEEFGTGLQLVQTNLKNAPCALIFRDSYTDLMIPFFNETFSTVIYTRNNYQHFNIQLIEKYKPDIVLQISVERALHWMPANLDLKQPQILNYGPLGAKAGRDFQLANTDRSAIWMLAANLSPDTVVLWDQTELKCIAAFEQSVITSIVPKKRYAIPGVHQLSIKDQVTGDISNTVPFEVFR